MWNAQDIIEYEQQIAALKAQVAELLKALSELVDIADIVSESVIDSEDQYKIIVSDKQYYHFEVAIGNGQRLVKQFKAKDTENETSH